MFGRYQSPLTAFTNNMNLTPSCLFDSRTILNLAYKIAIFPCYFTEDSTLKSLKPWQFILKFLVINVLILGANVVSIWYFINQTELEGFDFWSYMNTFIEESTTLLDKATFVFPLVSSTILSVLLNFSNAYTSGSLNEFENHLMLCMPKQTKSIGKPSTFWTRTSFFL